jgi:glycosyltransferase involved in cell wall biosynthesis
VPARLFGVTLLAAAIGMLGGALAIVGAYVAWLTLARRRTIEPHAAKELPPVLIVVAVYNEAALIARKLENLLALAGRGRIVIVDGGSTDGTIEIVRRTDVALIETQLRNKTAQLTEALRVFPDEPWVLVTDADAHLEPDTLARLFDVVAADPAVAVVGTRVRPVSAHAIESLHWRATDWLRAREYDRGSSAIVAAPCYLARREMLAVADDVHVACTAMRAGRLVGQSQAIVRELRSPRTLRALVRHKYRKGDAYLREIVRFLPLAPEMPRAMRAIFLWRAALLTLVPLLAMIGGASFVAAIALDGLWFLFPAALFLLLPPARGAALAALLAVVSFAVLITYPFSRQVASFPKIVEEPS